MLGYYVAPATRNEAQGNGSGKSYLILAFGSVLGTARPHVDSEWRATMYVFVGEFATKTSLHLFPVDCPGKEDTLLDSKSCPSTQK